MKPQPNDRRQRFRNPPEPPPKVAPAKRRTKKTARSK